MSHEYYFHWVFGENILRNDEPTYLINLEYGLSIRFDYAESLTSFEEFYESVADVQFLTGDRPNEKTMQKLLTDAWDFLTLFERKEDDYLH